MARRQPIACHHHVILEYRQHGANMTRDPAHMLRSAVSVRRRERFAPRRGRARRGGPGWRGPGDFGAALIDRIKGDLVAAGAGARCAGCVPAAPLSGRPGADGGAAGVA